MTGPLCVVQTLSPYNKGLIRRAISQSGVALTPWAIQKNPLFWAKRVWGSCSGRERGRAPLSSAPALASPDRLPTPPRSPRRWAAPWMTLPGWPSV